MERALTILALLIVAAVPDICLAMPMQLGPYVTGFLGATMPRRNCNVTTTDFSSNQTFDERVRFDPGVDVGGAGGFDFGYLRLEGELSYKEADIKSIADNTGVNQYRDIDGNLGALAFMANAFFDFHNYTPVTPYMGGGIGFATLHLSNTYATDANNNRLLMYPRDDNTVFAYQAGAGLNIALNRRYSLDLGYRYFNTDWASFSRYALTTSSVRFESHNATVGFRIKF
ncbi:MAG: outer membrane beta-barrel protein [Oryzomonas sp.]|uniref:outer membrane protein n=1 Tax=Oryzomonas sp. TaxID=2855186 RepID=UPI002848AD1A|nr:outer membrane beta-barrel protein [Oryzomonas sp.]MDR3581630.1 outer membrane beta-barrel protein [Oryzomonas sp.]